MSANSMETKYIKNQVVEEERCSFTTNHGNRCRNAHLGNASGLCAVHEDVPKSRDKKEIEAEEQAVSEFLLEKNVGLCTKDDVNRFTSQLLTLVTQKKVSRQDGSLLAYVMSLLLQTIAPVKEEEVATGGGRSLLRVWRRRLRIGKKNSGGDLGRLLWRNRRRCRCGRTIRIGIRGS